MWFCFYAYQNEYNILHQQNYDQKVNFSNLFVYLITIKLEIIMNLITNYS